MIAMRSRYYQTSYSDRNPVCFRSKDRNSIVHRHLFSWSNPRTYARIHIQDEIAATTGVSSPSPLLVGGAADLPDEGAVLIE